MAQFTIRQTGSPIRRDKTQRATLIGLGLNKIGREATLEDNPSNRGAVWKVRHMVTVLESPQG